MSGVNKAIVVGRLGVDPEIRTVTGGQTVARLSIATSEMWTDRDGKKQERTEWHRVSVWGKTAENCGKFLSKGSQVYVEGRLQTRSWEDPQGQKKYSTEIVATTVQFLGSGSGAQQGGYDRNSGGDRAGQSNYGSSSAGVPSGGAGFDDFGPEPQFDSSEQMPF